ncbi:hypothetical protein A2617_02965 [Candidatus Daviesbacteria bacterium RIFOXYD1_FULL_41_10]|uniref:Mannosyl-glycoprotein endo-beta-N-acetylglucosamidase-like domain-containing protein n=2 Tax=Candidatus Daviesiibacteriota TaxID=1752718 RepID=A0A1F5N3B9_9BACT|nr:MAG: hypothetical protein UU67_C0071G0004 [Candidatus Daviesbacteria bacterium GW2011_GWB1_41_5]OGE72129.1 MAG: hypothetical protein A2617_02965 [Candidatus Daviesbacteria bacterium RIFOXYD1_FULL_41_10]
MLQDFFVVTKRLLLLLLIIPLLSSQPAPAEGDLSEPKIEVEAKQFDSRAQMLSSYLSKYNSPLQYQAQHFVDAADENNLDWKLVASIAGVESTFGKFIPGGYNAWGWGVYGTNAIYFNSWKDGIYTVSRGLRQNYFNRGLTTPDSINRVYAASPTWGTKVSYFLTDMEEFEKEYKVDLAQK